MFQGRHVWRAGPSLWNDRISGTIHSTYSYDCKSFSLLICSIVLATHFKCRWKAFLLLTHWEKRQNWIPISVNIYWIIFHKLSKSVYRIIISSAKNMMAIMESALEAEFSVHSSLFTTNFDEMMELDLSDIVWSHQMHSRTHMPICFKFKLKKCRACFPRKIVNESTLDTSTGIISMRRNHSWMNNYNKWIAIMVHANHDCQIVLSKTPRSGYCPLHHEIHH